MLRAAARDDILENLFHVHWTSLSPKGHVDLLLLIVAIVSSKENHFNKILISSSPTSLRTGGEISSVLAFIIVEVGIDATVSLRSSSIVVCPQQYFHCCFYWKKNGNPYKCFHSYFLFLSLLHYEQSTRARFDTIHSN